MKKVEILTANTISIQYETASLIARGAALLIDFAIKIVYVVIAFMLFGSMFRTVNIFENPSIGIIIFYAFIWFPITFYSLVLEYLLKGQTVGKLALGIRVVSLNGQNAKFNDYAMRWAFRIVDFWFSLGGIGAMLIATSENSQRIGDILAQTIVVKSKPEHAYSINDILNIKTKKEHQPQYLAVSQFTDDDMIIVKNTLSRYKKYPNEAHKEAVTQMSQRMAEALKLPTVPDKKITFLKAVLEDYVVLTR